MSDDKKEIDATYVVCTIAEALCGLAAAFVLIDTIVNFNTMVENFLDMGFSNEAAIRSYSMILLAGNIIIWIVGMYVCEGCRSDSFEKPLTSSARIAISLATLIICRVGIEIFFKVAVNLLIV